MNVFLLLFKPICNILNIPTEFSTSLITGLLEITNGISLIANIHFKQISVNVILASFLLGIGGLSVLLQVWSIVSKSDLSIKPYILGKLLQGILAAFYTYLMISIFPIFNFNL
jgi:nucleoside recognition membrane protein YjiH